MNKLQPIYTEKAECQDCYKCLRQCPVKAIKIENGHASVMGEHCVLCGHCVTVCPVGAKQVRNEIARTKRLLERKSKVYVSLAPSFLSEFPNLTREQIVAGIKALGFHAVSETALGAQEVSAHVARLLAENESSLLISTACPAAVLYIKREFPEFVPYFTPLLSPLLAHAKEIKEKMGIDSGIVFIGPCIAKKDEADHFPDLVDIALTFDDLRQWWKENNIHPETMPHSTDTPSFFPCDAQEGTIYPVDGGMIATIEKSCPADHQRLMSFSGLKAIKEALSGINPDELTESGPYFLELLACEGGCINGPKSRQSGATVLKRHSILANTETCSVDYPRQHTMTIDLDIEQVKIMQNIPDENAINAALRTIGKPTRKDEVNCGACGYDNCRDFAAALLEQRAEKTMCVTYMKKLAQNKAAALMNTMPSGVVIVDEKLQIVDCNRRFAVICGRDIETIFDADPGLAGAVLPKVFPFFDLFRHALDNGADIVEKDVKMGSSYLRLSIFTVEPHRLVGAVVRDVTAPAVQKEMIIEKAKNVVEKHLSTVQQIAYLLGENASETEILMKSITDSFAPQPIKTVSAREDA
ncbi:PAS domain-containing protein [bacterium]|nr:PAS domain-containing protein [bacterium]